MLAGGGLVARSGYQHGSGCWVIYSQCNSNMRLVSCAEVSGDIARRRLLGGTDSVYRRLEALGCILGCRGRDVLLKEYVRMV